MKICLVLGAAALAPPATVPAFADNISWTDWNYTTYSASSGSTPGTATGSIALGTGVNVTYSGQFFAVDQNYPDWTPTSSYSGGTISNAPPTAPGTGDGIALTGGQSFTETITFSQSVHDPTMAFWSLGGGSSASFVFSNATPVFEGGGPGSDYGGSAIIVSGNTVSGAEGDGVVMFIGDFTQLTFTTPQYEDYYAFTVGADGLTSMGNISATPEPGSLLLLGTGLLGLPGMARFRRRR